MVKTVGIAFLHSTLAYSMLKFASMHNLMNSPLNIQTS